MKCSDVDRILPDILEGVPVEGGQDIEVQSHLRTCPDCSELVSDLKLIVGEARQLADSEEPSPRVWARIAAELRAEGLIREPELAQTIVAPTRQHRWNPFWLAPVAAAVLAAGAYVLTHDHAKAVPHNVAEVRSQESSTPMIAQEPPAQELTGGSPAGAPAQSAAQSPADNSVEEAEVSAPASDNDLLTEVSTRAPSMRATYAGQLQAVNNEIQETKAYIARNPGDIDARQHLLEVYQQKAMLYQMALDRIQ
jgi:hypothetical protein